MGIPKPVSALALALPVALLLASCGNRDSDPLIRILWAEWRPSDALALCLRTRAPVFVDTKVLDRARSVETTNEQLDRDRLQRWLESLDPDDLGYKM